MVYTDNYLTYFDFEELYDHKHPHIISIIFFDKGIAAVPHRFDTWCFYLV